MPPKLVASDLDGTLVRSDNTIDDRTRRALAAAEAAGASVVFCTARPHRGLHELAEATGYRGVVICNNGAMLWDLHTESVLGAEVPGGARAVERTGGFGHEPEYVTRWPIPEGPRSTPCTHRSPSRLCEQRGISRHEVIAFGDMPNDLPMLAWAGHSVAVANAHPDVRAAADELTASNDEAGVALVLERLFS
jgi:hydroxymethylpyrimidine pyrophosphatase-like HAD family hydrolase